MLRLLCQYPSAASIKQAKRSKIAKVLIPGSYGKQTPASVDRILKAAQGSVGTSSPTKEIILKQKASLLMQLEQHLQRAYRYSHRTLPREDPGRYGYPDLYERNRGEDRSKFYDREGGDIKQFESHKKVIAMAGLDSALYQSGKIDRKGKISKRGNRHLRRVIWLMTTKVIQFNERFKQYYLKRIKDGLPYKKGCAGNCP